MRFTKMHGLGNDFIVVDGTAACLPDAAGIRRLADRTTGIGFDQLLWLEPSQSADIRYRIFNADGAEVEQCGNGARCIARWLADRDGAVTRAEYRLAHESGIATALVEPGGDVAVELGVPDFAPASLPFVADRQRDAYPIDVCGQTVTVRIVSIGNPHAVIAVDDVDDAPLQRLGAALESHDRFPNRANIGFMQVVAADRIRLRVFERGAGETRACGTGACAAVVVGRQAGELADNVVVELPGGAVTVRWEGPGAPVWLTGDAVTVFEGTIEV